MRRRASLGCLCCCLTALAGCAKSDSKSDQVQAQDTAAGVPAVPPAAASARESSPGARPLALTDVAGTWTVRSVPETGDTTTTTFRMVAKGDSAGWVQLYSNRKPIPIRIVQVAGDSVVTESGPFESVRRKGLQVRTHSVWRLQGDRLVGSTVARYTTTKSDSVLRLRSEGTRAP
jgi:hypothetical protein